MDRTGGAGCPFRLLAGLTRGLRHVGVTPVPLRSPLRPQRHARELRFPRRSFVTQVGLHRERSVSIPGIGGGREVWFNSGDRNYYVAAENDPVGPVFGVIASGATSTPNTLTQMVPTLPPVPAVAGIHSAGTVQSIAASAAKSRVCRHASEYRLSRLRAGVHRRVQRAIIGRRRQRSPNTLTGTDYSAANISVRSRHRTRAGVSKVRDTLAFLRRQILPHASSERRIVPGRIMESS